PATILSLIFWNPLHAQSDRGDDYSVVPGNFRSHPAYDSIKGLADAIGMVTPEGPIFICIGPYAVGRSRLFGKRAVSGMGCLRMKFKMSTNPFISTMDSNTYCTPARPMPGPSRIAEIAAWPWSSKDLMR